MYCSIYLQGNFHTIQSHPLCLVARDGLHRCIVDICLYGTVRHFQWQSEVVSQVMQAVLGSLQQVALSTAEGNAPAEASE